MSKKTELFELCKEVYKRTGWKEDTTGFGMYYTEDVYEDGSSLWNQYCWSEGKAPNGNWIPKYSIEYIMPLMPSGIQLVKMATGNNYMARKNYGSSTTHTRDFYNKLRHESDTPLKALLRLTIALHKVGELK